MDISEQYIKQCDCPEIQDNWEPHIGDWIGGEWFIDNNDNIGFTCLGVITGLNPEGHEDCVSTRGSIFWDIKASTFLPRQDQIQDMIEIGMPNPPKERAVAYFSAFGLLKKFLAWCEEGSGSYFGSDKSNLGFMPSMEQLWLAFLMKEKFNKSWNGREWV